MGAWGEYPPESDYADRRKNHSPGGEEDESDVKDEYAGQNP
jgi:hypothetical protein